MNRVAIMQPYFFPYLGYFSLIKHVDEFILFDTPQFIRHGWIERNRIQKQPDSWLYIKVPLQKHAQQTAIKDVIINNDTAWKQTILAQLDVYRKAPFYPQIKALVEKALDIQTDSIVELNKHSLKIVCEYLGINTPIQVFTKMNLTIEQPNAPDEWALNICKALGEDVEYWNPPGGRKFFDRGKYKQAGVGLKFQKINLIPYTQRRENFEVGLSILDVLMFNAPQDISKMLDAYELD